MSGQALYEALAEVFADHGKVNSLAWTDRAARALADWQAQSPPYSRARAMVTRIIDVPLCHVCGAEPEGEHERFCGSGR